jgi:hypothetical protein
MLKVQKSLGKQNFIPSGAWTGTVQKGLMLRFFQQAVVILVENLKELR